MPFIKNIIKTFIINIIKNHLFTIVKKTVRYNKVIIISISITFRTNKKSTIKVKEGF